MATRARKTTPKREREEQPEKPPQQQSEKRQLTKNQQELEELKKHVPASEFGGVLGTFILTFALPFVIYWVWGSINYNDGYLLFPKEFSGSGIGGFFVRVYEYGKKGAIPTWNAFFIYFGWFLFQAALQHFVPGKEVLGSPLPGGTRLKYWLNGWTCWWITLAAIPIAWVIGIPLTIFVDNYGPLITVVNIWAFVFTFLLKIHAYLKNEEERMSGWFPYDFWMGFARNPRIGTFLRTVLTFDMFAVVILTLKALGYYLFRWVNSQKHEFRRHVDEPDYNLWGKKPTYIHTKRGTKLLTSGFWGLARHLNYTGDIILSWTWCLPCGFDSFAPYFYGIYFTSLDFHRCWRDHNECKKKYGEDWEKYCKTVPYPTLGCVLAFD